MHPFGNQIISRLFLIGCYLLFSASLAHASLRTSADSAYLGGDFTLAQKLYDQTLADEGPHPDVYFNLGNTEYRLGHAPQAILCYQRALKYQPSHKAALDNLERLQLKQHIVFERPDEMFFFTFYRQFIQGRSSNVWVGWSIALLILALSSLAVVICWRSRGVRISSLAVCLLSLVLCVLFADYSLAARERIEKSSLAVVMEKSEIRQSPSVNAKSTHQLIAGTTLSILLQEDGWYRISLPDGSVGWIQAEAIEIV